MVWQVNNPSKYHYQLIKKGYPMFPAIPSTDPFQPVRRGWLISLWTLQILLAVLYGMSGVMNTFMSPEQLVAMNMSHAAVLSLGWLRFLGVAGLILPTALRIKPALTPLAAQGVVALQICAIVYHLLHGEFFMLPANVILIALAAFVWWGRTKKAPVSVR
ncbi:DoxX family protein [Pectobacterium brasiliense]|uniref:DoxX family protein n=1 Tax=Pectobacterium brasiliense TaxID=180957 RepID=UPI001968FFD3|nr:DoxX family protein [Pectobacterium brasiliense]MBN3229322.1 DoxX family protein [Pectobacterium brasiliense]